MKRMCDYLVRREGRYYFRRPIPKALQPYVGRGVQFMWSLKTADPVEGKRRVQEETTRTNGLLDDARNRLARCEAPLAARTSATGMTAEQFGAWERDQFEYAQRGAEASYQDSEREEWTRINNPDAFRVSDAVAAARAVWEQEQREARRAVAAANAAKAVSITGLFEGYVKQPGIRVETARQFRAIIVHLVAHLGHDDASRVKPADIVGWRNALREEVSVRGKPRSPATINGSYLAAANVTFKYGVDQLAIPANPLANIAKVRREKKIHLRERDFTKAEQSTILLSALDPVSPRLSPTYAKARRWVPWLCAYTGARVNEITQLRGQDVQQIDGVWIIHITPEAGSVKTDKSRVVPIHAHLISQGFVEVCAANGQGPLFYDPASERTGMARGQYKKVGMKLAQWVRSLGLSDATLQPNHAWRHTFKTICREVGVAEGAADYVQGHAPNGISRDYGSNTIPALVLELGKFPAFDVVRRA